MVECKPDSEREQWGVGLWEGVNSDVGKLANSYASRMLNGQSLGGIRSLLGEGLRGVVAIETFLVLEAAYNSLETGGPRTTDHLNLFKGSNGAKPLYYRFSELLDGGEKDGVFRANITLKKDVTDNTLFKALCAAQLFFRDYIRFANKHMNLVPEDIAGSVLTQFKSLEYVLAPYVALERDPQHVEPITPPMPSASAAAGLELTEYSLPGLPGMRPEEVEEDHDALTAEAEPPAKKAA